MCSLLLFIIIIVIMIIIMNNINNIPLIMQHLINNILNGC